MDYLSDEEKAAIIQGEDAVERERTPQDVIKRYLQQKYPGGGIGTALSEQKNIQGARDIAGYGSGIDKIISAIGGTKAQPDVYRHMASQAEIQNDPIKNYLRSKQRFDDKQASFAQRQQQIVGQEEYQNKMAKLKEGELKTAQELEKSKAQSKSAEGLRKEFTSNPTTKETQQVASAYERIKKSAENPSPAGDLALIFNYMKMLDPGSTVREGEFANAQNSAGIPERMRAQYNSVVNGQRLSDSMRKDFVSRSSGLMDAQLQSQSKISGFYRSRADEEGIDPGKVIIPFGGEDSTKVINGAKYKKVEGGWKRVE